MKVSISNPQSSTRHNSISRQGILAIILRTPHMPSLFNIIRLCIYMAVLVFAIICLSLAANFQHVLAASDLTHFVPFAIFVCSASLFIISTLLGFSIAKGSGNPISTRIELACLGLVGTFWLALGAFLATSESQDANVECFAAVSDTTPLPESEASLQTSAFHAMYRVLMVFSLMSAFLLLISFIVLLCLALQRYYTGDEQMWYGPVTSCPWFTKYHKSDSSLPGPGGKMNGGYAEKTHHRPSRQHSRQRDHGRTTHSRPAYLTPVPDVFNRIDAYRRDASPRRK